MRSLFIITCLWACSLFSFKVVLDPGHGGKFHGALSSHKLFAEKDINLDVSRRVADILKKYSIETVLTHPTDTNLDKNLDKDLLKRAAIATRDHADLFVSIHFNSSPGKSTEGFELYIPLVSPVSGASYQAASYIDRELALHKGIRSCLTVLDGLHGYNRGIHQARFKVLHHALVPAVLVELEFISNPEVEKYLAMPTCREKLANGVAQGILKYAQVV
jgi:N-acetylmuramoyl-L-alanine amidase